MKDPLTLVLFRHGFSARTLQFTPKLIQRLGYAALIVIFVALFSIGMLVYSWRVSRGAVSHSKLGMNAPLSEQIDDLEKQIGELKATNENLNLALKSQAGAPNAVTSHTPFTPVSSVSGGLFLGIPNASLIHPLPARDTLSFRLEPLKASWKGSTLHITTALEYIREDGGNLQGHFILLARGAHTVFAYPDTSFNPAGSDTLIRPESGEYFSVSRYREIKAEFGPVLHHEDIQSIEILIFDSNKELIYIERAGLQSMKPNEAPAAAATKRKSEPSAMDPAASMTGVPTPAPTITPPDSPTGTEIKNEEKPTEGN